MAITRRAVVTGLIGIGAAGQAAAASLSPITGRPILTVSGRIKIFNAGETAVFDRPLLESLGMTGFVTTTPWYDGPVRFDGVPMARLMEAVGATGETLIATALNDYETRIPVSDLAEFGVLLALKRNNEYMPVRDKGPLFIVYPFDSNRALKNQKYYSRSAWQLARIVVA
jgi:hypothetical protein